MRGPLLPLAALPPGVIFCPDTGGFAFGHEMAISLYFPQDAARLNHSLEAAQ
jgi:hypothetical protein